MQIEMHTLIKNLLAKGCQSPAAGYEARPAPWMIGHRTGSPVPQSCRGSGGLPGPPRAGEEPKGTQASAERCQHGQEDPDLHIHHLRIRKGGFKGQDLLIKLMQYELENKKVPLTY